MADFQSIFILKVRQFENEFMNSSFLPKYEQKIAKISALTAQGQKWLKNVQLLLSFALTQSI